MNVFQNERELSNVKEQGQEYFIRYIMECGKKSRRGGPKINENLAFTGLRQKWFFQLSTNSPSRQGYRRILGDIGGFLCPESLILQHTGNKG